MYELIQAGARTYYFECPVRVGLWRISDTEVCLIDSGSDKDAAKKMLRAVTANGWTLTAVYLTHSNADHIGGCRYLQQQTGCRVYAPGIECAFTNHPILEPAFLYGGFPPKELRHKFLLAQECECRYLTEDVLPEGLEMIELPGHFFEMAGFRTGDDVVFLADCLSSRETLEKYRIGVVYDAAAYLETLERVKTMTAALFVPAHVQPSTEIAALAQYNIDVVNEICDRIVELCAEPIGFEALLQRLFEAYGLTMSFEQYALVGSTVRSYLAFLKESGRLRAVIEDNMLLWTRA